MSIEPDDEDVVHIVTSYMLESKYSDTCRYIFIIILDMWAKFTSSTNSTIPPYQSLTVHVAHGE